MTGEITLRGRVLPVGGIKEKVLAAHRAGLKKVIIPARNQKDLVELRKKVLRELQVIYVDSMDEVLKLALAPVAKTSKAVSTKTSKSKPKSKPKVARRIKQPTDSANVGRISAKG